MCGVIGLIYERERSDLGLIAERLLKTLEYRGYDSTGAAIQGAAEDVELRKGVGAPSVMAKQLGIVDMGGQILCAQVRWATFGAVDEVNAQPHVVRCHTFLYGAHNGNVTNCDGLKDALTADGHAVLSDNDGEMLVHSVEHAFAARLEQLPEQQRRDDAARSRAMRQAVVTANTALDGSYAAIVVDPVTRRLCAVKKGSSLYFGIGEDEQGGRFGIASSDLSSVLKLTRRIVTLLEGEFVQFDATGYTVYRLEPGEDGGGVALERTPGRSRLRAEDTALRPEFSSYMEQEIADQSATVADVVRVFGGGSAAARAVAPAVVGWSPAQRQAVDDAAHAVLDAVCDDDMLAALAPLGAVEVLAGLPALLPEPGAAGASALCSPEHALLMDLTEEAASDEQRRVLRALDALWEHDEVTEIAAVVQSFCEACEDTLARGGRIYVVCCGTSYHAAKVAALFFAELAGVELLALLPGEFRGQHGATLRDGDLLLAVSQSGETKDLIDVVNVVIASGRDVRRVALVNNVNSTLAQEKCDLVVPLRCGPEIAVPATKSFLNQLTVFYALGLELAQRRRGDDADLDERRRSLASVPGLIERTLCETDEVLDEAAELLFLAPSMHLLATRLLGVAKEGALKVREVVLNHTEGFEGSEFKHGPNTILGFNTIFGPRQIETLLARVGERVDALTSGTPASGAVGDAGSDATGTSDGGSGERSGVEAGDQNGGGHGSDVRAVLSQVLADTGALLDGLGVDYPLVYITGPDERDVALTVSQMNTHKIRGSCTVVVAEEDPALRGAATKAPADNPDYRAIYVTLPPTGDTLMTVFTSIVALQRLALKMSTAKLAWLDAHGIKDHGVHPDVPKNVSKSITVD